MKGALAACGCDEANWGAIARKGGYATLPAPHRHWACAVSDVVSLPISVSEMASTPTRRRHHQHRFQHLQCGSPRAGGKIGSVADQPPSNDLPGPAGDATYSPSNERLLVTRGWHRLVEPHARLMTLVGTVTLGIFAYMTRPRRLVKERAGDLRSWIHGREARARRRKMSGSWSHWR